MILSASPPVLDLGAEASGSMLDIAIVLAIALLGFAYLLRGFLRKHKRTLSGEGCGGCAGCGASGGSCQIAPEEMVLPEKK